MPHSVYAISLTEDQTWTVLLRNFRHGFFKPNSPLWFWMNATFFFSQWWTETRVKSCFLCIVLLFPARFQEKNLADAECQNLWKPWRKTQFLVGNNRFWLTLQSTWWWNWWKDDILQVANKWISKWPRFNLIRNDILIGNPHWKSLWTFFTPLSKCIETIELNGALSISFVPDIKLAQCPRWATNKESASGQLQCPDA